MNDQGFVKWIIIFVLLLVLGAGAYLGVIYYLQKKKAEGPAPAASLTQVTLNDDIIAFTFRSLPEIYNNLVLMNNELIKLDAEIARLKSIDTQYPHQGEVVKPAEESWDQLRKEIADILTQAQKDLENLYVQYLVDATKAQSAIDAKKPELQKATDDILKKATELTQNLAMPSQAIGPIKKLLKSAGIPGI